MLVCLDSLLKTKCSVNHLACDPADSTRDQLGVAGKQGEVGESAFLNLSSVIILRCLPSTLPS